MADITNVEAVRFCNEKVRVAADKLAQAYYFAAAVQQEWFANNLSALITNSAEDNVVDGSASDGRHPITGADATNIITRCSELITDMEANSNAKLNTVLNVSVNPTRGIN